MCEFPFIAIKQLGVSKMIKLCAKANLQFIG